MMQVDPSEKKTCYLELPSSLDALDQLWEEVYNLVSAEKAEMFMFGLHELAANAMEHGNRLDPEKKVFIELTVTEQFIAAVVEDQGTGFSWGDYVDNPIEFQLNQERGRGIALTRLYCDRLYFNKTGNKAIAIKKLHQGNL